MMLCQNSGSELDNDPFALFGHETVSANNAIIVDNANKIGAGQEETLLALSAMMALSY